MTIDDKMLAKSLRKRAEEASHEPLMPLIKRIVALRGTIIDLHDQGHSTGQIAGWLAVEGIPISKGTLRNYIMRIVAAQDQALHENITNPTDDDILRIYRTQRRVPSSIACQDRLPEPRSTSKQTPSELAEFYADLKSTLPQSKPQNLTPRSDDDL